MAQPAACACGQVLFDIGDKKPGDVLTCPWCDRKYRYAGGGKVELYDPKAPASQPEKPKEEPRAASSEKAAKLKEAKADTREKDGGTKEHPKVHSERREKSPEPHSVAVALKGAGELDAGHGARPSVRKRAAKGDVPGGVLVMIAFIVVFNGAAFIAMYFVLPELPDHSGRIAPWGHVFPASSVWPLIGALLLGHFVGFVAWSTYLYLNQAQRVAPEVPVEKP